MKTETGSHATPFQTEFLMGGGAARREAIPAGLLL
jgi:hypothetical protein